LHQLRRGDNSGLAGLPLPRDNKSLDIKQQYHGENSKATKEATLRRH
jgi:hypothetical protein